MKDSSTKREEILKPTNPAAQKALMANQHKVSPRPMAKIKPKALSGVMNGNKVHAHFLMIILFIEEYLHCLFTI